MKWFQLLAGLLATLVGATAHAQDSEEPRGPDLEYPQGPVVTSNRVVGLGGAYVGVAEGASGHLYNPASFAVRYPYTRNDLIDWDWTLYGLGVPRSQNPDLYGEVGEARDTNYGGGGIDLKVGQFGIGVHARGQDYSLDTAAGTVARVSNATLGLGIAAAHDKLNIVMGGYAYLYAWTVETDPAAGNPRTLGLTGGGTRLGLLWMPPDHPVRVGVVYRDGLRAGEVAVDEGFDATLPPSAIVIPSRLTLGTSYMFGERSYNPRHTWGLQGREPGDEEEARGRYVRVSYDLVLTGTSPGAVSMRGYLRGEEIPAGREPTLGVRIGVESEVWDNWLVLRNGYYFEPPRTTVVPGRHHGTGGFAFRLPFGEWISFWPWDLRLDGAFDVARNYLNAGLGLGFWH